MSSKLSGQLPLLIVQRTVALLPAAMPVIVVVGLPALVTVAVPLSTLQVPTPTAGVFAAIVNIPLSHWSRSTPASDVVGLAVLVKVTSSSSSGHKPLLIVQRNTTLLPAFKPVTPLVAVPGVVITAPFAAPTMLQTPVPTVGTLPAKVNAPDPHCS